MDEVHRSHFKEQKRARNQDEEPSRRPPRPDRRRDDRGRNRDERRERDNVVSVVEKERLESKFLKDEFDRIMDAVCPIHKDANHTFRNCHSLRREVGGPSKKARKDDDRGKRYPRKKYNQDRDARPQRTTTRTLMVTRT